MQKQTPERIYHWLDSQLSIARHYGGCKFNGADYVIAYNEEGLYDRMQSLIDEGRRADGWTENAPGCWSRGERRSVQIGDGVRIGF